MCDTSQVVTHGNCRTRFEPLPDCGGEYVNMGSQRCGALGAGHQRLCRRALCLGDPQTCCVFGNSQNQHFRCNSTFTNNRFNSSACASHWSDYCSGGRMHDSPECRQWANENPQGANAVMNDTCANSRIFGVRNTLSGPGGPTSVPDSRQTFCWRWCRENPSQCQPLMQRYCSSVQKFNEPICREWVSADPARNRGFGGAGQVDGIMRSRCKSNPSDPLCACINIPDDILRRRNYNPVCIDARCASDGYITSNYLASRGDRCPNVIDCSVIIELEATGNIDFTNNVISQDCKGAFETTEIDIDQEEDPIEEAPPITPPFGDESPFNGSQGMPVDEPVDTPQLSYNAQLALLFLFLIMIIIGFGLVAYGVVNYYNSAEIKSTNI